MNVSIDTAIPDDRGVDLDEIQVIPGRMWQR